MRSYWGAESGDVESASNLIGLHSSHSRNRPSTFGRQFGHVVTLSALSRVYHNYHAGFDGHFARLSKPPGLRQLGRESCALE